MPNVKIKKDGQEYDIGVIPQSLYDDVEDLKDEIDEKVSDNPTFTEAQTRVNIASGETFATILGKIKKFFTDLKAVAFSGLASDVTYSNTQSGLSADNAQGAIDEITVKYALITFTIPSSGSTYNFTSLTPSGFNTSNCYPIVRAILSDAWYFDPSLLSVYFAGTAFMVSFPENYRGRDCKILLAKPTTII